MTSKFNAIIEQGIDVPLKVTDKILYLGASHGITPKILAEKVKKGFVFCVEISPVVMRTLLNVCQQNENMAPLLYDASKIEPNKIPKVDFIYQDLAQKNQVEILIKNIKKFLKPNGRFILIIKSRSIDAIKKKELIIKEAITKLKDYSILHIINLQKTHKDHFAIIGKNIKK
ncbi:MAG: fibrillarin-like rRNA/tRNA 2'-O-methyltransferase [Nanoarchaeota archaeon]|nr:fibrillarin-like rRNA/tRNA 2'-O-methyltransferase [Nanoarchaeota archaeon]